MSGTFPVSPQGKNASGSPPELIGERGHTRRTLDEAARCRLTGDLKLRQQISEEAAQPRMSMASVSD
jgi:hypothetical protein